MPEAAGGLMNSLFVNVVRILPSALYMFSCLQAGI
jgi:hypothetical protein